MEKGLLQPASAAVLLARPRRQRLLEHIWQRTSLSRAQFNLLYGAPIGRYAALVQEFPASEAHHHAYGGGMLDHALESVGYALKLRQSHLLPPGAPPETQAAQAEVWTACAAYAALLHDIGKVAVDLHIELADGTRWYPWHGALLRPYRFRYRKDRSYRLHNAATGLLYITVLESRILDWLNSFQEPWAALLCVLAGQYEHAGILGELVVQADQASVAHDLGGNPERVRSAPKHALQRKLLDGLRYLCREVFKLNQPQASDGWVTADALWLVSKTACDKLRAHLLSQGMSGVPDSNTALFDVLQDHGILQPNAESRAIWKATVTTEVGWTQTFTFLKLSPALIWEPDERPPPFQGSVCIDSSKSGTDEIGPSSESRVAPASRIVPPAAAVATAVRSPSDSTDQGLSLLGAQPKVPHNTEAAKAADGVSAGEPQPIAPAARAEHFARVTPRESLDFIPWLRGHIEARRLVINDAKALVHTVDGTVFLVSPGIFQRYIQEHPASRANAQPGIADWAWVQKRFEKMRIHRRHPNGLNIWTCEVNGPRKTRRLHGYLLSDATVLFATSPPDNPFLTLLKPSSTPDSHAA